MMALRTCSISVKSGIIFCVSFFSSIRIKKKRNLHFVAVFLKSNRKLHSLLLPLNLNLNYENLFVFSAKVLLLFYIAKFLNKKMQKFFIFQRFRPLM